MFRNIIPILFLLINTYSYASGPYIGADIGVKTLNFEYEYGDNLFAKELLYSNLFAGFKFNNYLGIEGGYETTENKKETISLGYPYYYLGTKAKYNNWLLTNTSTKSSGWHIGIVANYYLDGSRNSSIIAYAGIKRFKANLISHIYQDNLGACDFKDDLVKNNKKYIAKIAIGVEYLLFNNFGIRTFLSWENTRKLQPSLPNSNYLAKLKNSTGISVGIILKK